MGTALYALVSGLAGLVSRCAKPLSPSQQALQPQEQQQRQNLLINSRGGGRTWLGSRRNRQLVSRVGVLRFHRKDSAGIPGREWLRISAPLANDRPRYREQPAHMGFPELEWNQISTP